MSNVTCPLCDGPLVNSDAVAGQIVACPHCRRQIRMPPIIVSDPLADISSISSNWGSGTHSARSRKTKRTAQNRRRDAESLLTVFDFSFLSFITPQIIRFAYAVDILLVGGAAVISIFGIYRTMFQFERREQPTDAMLYFLAASFGICAVAVLEIVVVRIILEATMVVFRIEEHLQCIAENTAE